jgi:aminobenzoyl-glutamate utilization protein B
MKENNLSGTVLYFGCPGEEGGFGKTYMVREGLFNDVDCALTWHPAPGNMVSNETSLANYNIYYRFKGKSSHAAFSPQLGRSALDALELMNVGVNYLREHVPQDARMHYAVTNAGGKSPNVVQAESEEYFCMRSPKITQLREIYDRVCDIARGAALMTGTTVEYEIDSAVSEAIPNKTLGKLMHSNFSKLGAPEYDSEDYRVAEEYSSIISEAAKNSVPKTFAGKKIMDVLAPFNEIESIAMGSTDVADVSWVVPTVQCWVTCAANGTPLHSWEMVSQGKTSLAHKGMLHAGKVIAATAIDILRDPEILAKAKNELKERLGGQAYICPIPPEVKPSKTGKN